MPTVTIKAGIRICGLREARRIGKPSANNPKLPPFSEAQQTFPGQGMPSSRAFEDPMLASNPLDREKVGKGTLHRRENNEAAWALEVEPVCIPQAANKASQAS